MTEKQKENGQMRDWQRELMIKRLRKREKVNDSDIERDAETELLAERHRERERALMAKKRENE